MITIHATKKLFAKLPVDEWGFLPVEKGAPHLPGREGGGEPGLLSGWHANLITLQRRNCILFVHDSTRFPIFVTCLTKPDFARLDWHFQDAFMNTLLKIDASEAMMDKAASMLSVLCFDTVCDRSVQGTMIRMAGDIEHGLWYNDAKIADISPYRMAAWLAEMWFNVKGSKDGVWPYKGMAELLGGKREAQRLAERKREAF